MENQHQKLDRVLVVDDDPILRAIAERHFKKRGYQNVMSAVDGADALMTIDNSPQDPDFLLCDLNMPNMDGIQFLRHLEQRKFGGAIAILSGEDQSIVALAESLAKSHKLNVVGKLQKPLKAEMLDELITAATESIAHFENTSSVLINSKTLKNAIFNGEIVAYHQPKVHAQTKQFVGTEALARWVHPEWGIVSPAHFIPVAEQSGLIDQLTDSIINSAISDLQQWKAGGLGISCSINLSPKTFTNINLPDELAAKVDAAGLERSQIVLEITEGSLLEKDAVPMEILARMRLMGFELSIDDFGTGYSNIETLRTFPFSELKIDRSFISEMTQDAFALESVRTSVELGKKLGLRLVAEGVEQQAEYEMIKRMGVDYIQGYLFGKPMPSSQLGLWLKGYWSAA